MTSKLGLGKAFGAGIMASAKAIVKPRSTIRNGFKGFSRSLKASSGANQAMDMKKLARTSAAYLGTASGITYAHRLTRRGNKNPFEDSQGRRSIIPWVPFV